jgi:hypothetical protein
LKQDIAKIMQTSIKNSHLSKLYELLRTGKLFYLTNGIALHDSRQHSTHHYSDQYQHHKPHILCHYVADNIMFSRAICKEGNGKGFLQLANVHHSHRKCSLHADVLLLKLKILHPECFLSHHLQCRGVYNAKFIL